MLAEEGVAVDVGAVRVGDGGWTMNCRGIVMRCGEQLAHTTVPHFL